MTPSIFSKKVLASLLFIAVLLLVYQVFLVNVLRCWISSATFVFVIWSFLQVSGKPISLNIDPKAPAQEEKDIIIIKLPGVDIPLQKRTLVRLLVGLWNSFYLNWSKKITVPIVVLAVVCIPLGLLIPTVIEPRPIVFEFTAQSRDQAIRPGDVISVSGSTLITAKISGACALPCEWQTINGTMVPGATCSVYYTPPGNGEKDTLTVIARSPCKTTQTEATIFITSTK